MTKRKIGVYICHCGGNISDYVDVEKVKNAIKGQDDVVVAKTVMFACSDASQQVMIEDIKKEHLDGMVVASCSPKLHLHTFRGVASTAGINPYQYTQVNIREQDSWAHSDDKVGATEKAIKLVRAGIAKTGLSKPLIPLKIKTVPSVLIIGGGIAGLRAAVAVASLNLNVNLIEKEKELGGYVGKLDFMFPNDNSGKEFVNQLIEKTRLDPRISVFTSAKLISRSGSVGDFDIKIETQGETISLNVGSIIVATGFKTYEPAQGEFGYKDTPKVVSLLDMKHIVESSNGKLVYQNQEVRSIGVIHCVGSRQNAEEIENANTWCSRYCCTSGIHTSDIILKKYPKTKIYHFYRDIRTYGKYELIYEDARKRGALFLKFEDDNPPKVHSKNDKTYVTVTDALTKGEEITIPVDLVVLLTGMVPPETGSLVNILKIPTGNDGFLNEIHPKLRPVETVADGVFIAGASQAPRNSVESVASAMAATAKVAGLLKKGFVELEPIVAEICADECTWCGICAEACPYDAISKVTEKMREFATINSSLCKGCGGCIPVCPKDAIDLRGYTNNQIMAMIEAMSK